MPSGIRICNFCTWTRGGGGGGSRSWLWDTHLPPLSLAIAMRDPRQSEHWRLHWQATRSPLYFLLVMGYEPIQGWVGGRRCSCSSDCASCLAHPQYLCEHWCPGAVMKLSCCKEPQTPTILARNPLVPWVWRQRGRGRLASPYCWIRYKRTPWKVFFVIIFVLHTNIHQMIFL